MKKTIILLTTIVGFSANAQSWNLTGNAGTNPVTNFLGTTDNQPLIFKTNNIEKLRITEGNKFIVQGVLGAGMIWDKNLLFAGGNESTTGLYNTVFGFGAYTQDTKGTANTALGNNAMASHTQGDNNVAVGINAMLSSIDGIGNVSIGAGTLTRMTIGNYNTAVGFQSIYGGSASNVTGSHNTAVGAQALQGLHEGAAYNTGLGSQSLIFLRTGKNNIAIGYNNLSTNQLTNANNNIYIGNNLQASTLSPNDELNIGNWIVGNNGTIGIGTFMTQLPANGIAPDGEKYKLFVKDGIRTEKVKVDIAASNGWADYVFEKDYKLMPLNELDEFIGKNGHLPEVPTTKEAIEKGIELKEMNILLLKKVEELTLHAIEQQKRIEALESKFK